MLKWSIMKPMNCWEETESSQNLVQQLMLSKQDMMPIVPCLVKVKQPDQCDVDYKATPNLSQRYHYNSNSQAPNRDALLTPRQAIYQVQLTQQYQPQQNDEIWLILSRYMSNYMTATCSDLHTTEKYKQFAIPCDYDGLFTFVVNNRRLVKIYKTIKEMENDLCKSNRIVLYKPCIGFSLIDSQRKTNKTKATTENASQYRIHKLEEGTILKFEKFCFIETSKYDNETETSVDDHDVDHVAPTTATNKTNYANNNKKSILSTIFANFKAPTNYLSTPGGPTDSTTIRSNTSNSYTNGACLCAGITNQSCQSPSYSRYNKRVVYMTKADVRTPTPANKKHSKIVRVIKCYDTDTNAIIYIRDSSNGEFMIDDSNSSNDNNPNSQRMSYKYLYDINTLINKKSELVKLFDFNLNMPAKHLNNFDIELICKRSTKFDCLPFQRLNIDYYSLITIRTSQPTIIIYDVNKNKFYEYFLKSLLNTNRLKFYKSTKDTELLVKYKEKLDWCLNRLLEFKENVKLMRQRTGDDFVYLEQIQENLKSFRRHANTTSSLPMKAASSRAHTDAANHRRDMYIQKTDTILQHRNYDQAKNRLTNEDDELVTDKKIETRFKKVIKFATTTNRLKASRKRAPFEFEVKVPSQTVDPYVMSVGNSSFYNELPVDVVFDETTSADQVRAKSRQSDIDLINLNNNASRMHVSYMKQPSVQVPGHQSHFRTTSTFDINSKSSYFLQSKPSESKENLYKRSIQNLLNFNKPKTNKNSFSVNNIVAKAHQYENRNYEVTAI